MLVKVGIYRINLAHIEVVTEHREIFNGAINLDAVLIRFLSGDSIELKIPTLRNSLPPGTSGQTSKTMRRL